MKTKTPIPCSTLLPSLRCRLLLWTSHIHARPMHNRPVRAHSTASAHTII